MIDKKIIDKIISVVKDDDIIRQASLLLFSLPKRFSIEESLEATIDFLKSKGWILKTTDKEFIKNINQKSIIDIEKWIDFNMKKI